MSEVPLKGPTSYERGTRIDPNSYQRGTRVDPNSYERGTPVRERDLPPRRDLPQPRIATNMSLVRGEVERGGGASRDGAFRLSISHPTLGLWGGACPHSRLTPSAVPPHILVNHPPDGAASPFRETIRVLSSISSNSDVLSDFFLYSNIHRESESKRARERMREREREREREENERVRERAALKRPPARWPAPPADPSWIWRTCPSR